MSTATAPKRDNAEAAHLERQPMWRSIALFALNAISVDGSCRCRESKCARAGKHPAVKWSKVGPGEKLLGGPNQGYGVITGMRSGGLVVFDIDKKDGRNGFPAFAELQRTVGVLPPTFAVGSPTGGQHLYYRTSVAGRIKNSVDRLASGIDIRAEGGYVVGPGSPHKKGGHYRVVDSSEIAELPPAWVAHLLKLSSKRPSARAGRSSRPKPTASTSTPSPGPARPTTRSLTADDVRRLAEGGNKYADAFSAVLRGEVFAESGARHETLTGMMGLLANQYPTIDPASVEALFEPSMARLREMDEQSGAGVYPVGHVAATFASFVTDDAERGLSKTAHRRMAARSGTNANYTEADLAKLARFAGVTVAELDPFWILQRGSDFYFLTDRGYSGPFSNMEFMAQARRMLAPASSAGVSLYFEEED